MAALAGALAARDTLDTSDRGQWAWLPVTEADSSAAWLLFRTRTTPDAVGSNTPLPAFLVHDEQSFAAVTGGTQAVLMSTIDPSLRTRGDASDFPRLGSGRPVEPRRAAYGG